jgi:hypothetical protein
LASVGFVVEVGATTAVFVFTGAVVALGCVVAVFTGVDVGVNGVPPGVIVDVAAATPTTRTFTRLESLPPALATFEITVLPGVLDFTRTWIVTDAGFTSVMVSEQLTVCPDEQVPAPELTLTTSRLLLIESSIVTVVFAVLVVITEML